MAGLLSDLTHLDPFQRWAIICAAALTILYAVMRPWRKRKDPLARAPVSLSAQRQVEKQMTELLVELEQMARQMTAQLDTRSAKLELLIKEADERLAALRAAVASTIPGDTTFAGSAWPAFACPPDPLHADVYDLADQGRSARQIAQQLGKPYGEIELILALRGHEKAQTVSAAS